MNQGGLSIGKTTTFMEVQVKLITPVKSKTSTFV